MIRDGAAKVKTNIKKVKKVVFNGGGAVGVAHALAYAAFIACGGDPDQIDEVAGTSAGSIIAIFVALNYSPQALSEEMAALDLMEFLDGEPALIKAARPEKQIPKALGKIRRGPSSSKNEGEKGFIAKLKAAASVMLAAPVIKQRVIKRKGIFKGEKLREWIEAKIKAKTGFDYCTFEQLHELSKHRPGYKGLTLVSLNAKTRTIEYFDYRQTPKAIISDVARASSAIPTFFEAALIRENNNDELTELPGLYLDGGVINNYPINVFRANKDEVLGFYLCNPAVAAYLHGRGPLPETPTQTYFQLLKNNFAAIYDQQYATLMASEVDKACTIAISNTNINVVDFDLSNRPADLTKLLKAGWDASCEYFGKNIPFPGIEPENLNQTIRQHQRANKVPAPYKIGKEHYPAVLLGLLILGYAAACATKGMDTKNVLLYSFILIVVGALVKKAIELAPEGTLARTLNIFSNAPRSQEQLSATNSVPSKTSH